MNASCTASCAVADQPLSADHSGSSASTSSGSAAICWSAWRSGFAPRAAARRASGSTKAAGSSGRHAATDMLSRRGSVEGLVGDDMMILAVTR